MIYLDKLTLHNFRCFENCEITFEPDLTVLIARNGQGKTALLDAVALSYGLFVDTIAGTTHWKGFQKRDIRRVRMGDKTVVASGHVEFTAEAEFAGQHLTWRRWMRTDAKRAITSKKDATTLIGAISDIQGKLATEGAADIITLPLIAYYGTGRRWNQNPIVRSSLFDTPVNERCIGYTNCLSGSAGYDLFVEWYEETFRASASTPVTGSQKANRPEYLLASVNSAVDRVLESETGWNGLFWDEDDRQLVLTHPVYGQLPLDFMSDGVRSTAALIADIAHRCARLNPHLEDAARLTPGILLIDEVDLHLHPQWQQTILRMIREAFPNLQLIASTHSPQVVSTVPTGSIRIVDRDRIYAAPPGTDGAEAQRILEDVFKVPARAKTEMARLLEEYLRLVDSREWSSGDAIKLRRQLDEWSKGEEPKLLEADLQIENMKWEAGE